MDFKDKSKKSILNTLLLKRSTKIEPHPSSDDQNDDGQTSSDMDQYRPLCSAAHDSNPFQTSMSANSTPIKRLHKIGRLNRLWHCHSSNQSLTSNHSAPSYFLRKISTSTKKKIRNKSDRHSHPISNTQTTLPDAHNTYDMFYATDDNYIDSDQFDDRPKDSSQKQCVRFHANANGGHSISRSISNERFNGGRPMPCLVTSKSTEQIIVNDIDESVLCDSSHQQSPTSKSHDGNFTSSRDESEFPVGHSIAMSACRSRLRERLLPPAYVNRQMQQSNEQHQHFSFPDIVEKSARQPVEHRNSRSISCDLLANAKRTGKTESLAKNSLMAAQLINLIPTEVARERYGKPHLFHISVIMAFNSTHIFHVYTIHTASCFMPRNGRSSFIAFDSFCLSLTLSIQYIFFYSLDATQRAIVLKLSFFVVE